MDEDDSQEENLERTGQKQRNTRSCRKNANRNDSRDKSNKSSEATKARKRKTASSEDDPSFSDVEEEEDLSGQHKKVPGYRCSPRLIPELMKGLSVKQKQWVKNIDFHPLLDMIDSRMPKCLTLWLVDRVDTESGTLEVCGVPIDIKKAVVRILNLPCGENKVPPPLNGRSNAKRPKGESSSLTQRHSDKGRGQSAKDATQLLLKENENEEDFCRSFVMLVLCIYLAPTTLLNINRNYFTSLMDVSKIKSMDWCGFIADYLIQGIKEYRKSAASHVQVPGCVHILPLLYVDALIQFKALVLPQTLSLPEGEPRIHFIGSDHLAYVASADVISRSKDNVEYGLLQQSCKSGREVPPSSVPTPPPSETDKLCQENPGIPTPSGLIEEKAAAVFIGRLLTDIKESRKNIMKQFEEKMEISEQSILSKYQHMLAKEFAAVSNPSPIEANVMKTAASTMSGNASTYAEHSLQAQNSCTDFQQNHSSLLPPLIPSVTDVANQSTVGHAPAPAPGVCPEVAKQPTVAVALEEQHRPCARTSEPKVLDSHVQDTVTTPAVLDSSNSRLTEEHTFEDAPNIEQQDQQCNLTSEPTRLESLFQDSIQTICSGSSDLDLQSATEQQDIDPLEYAANIGNEAAEEALFNRQKDDDANPLSLSVDFASAILNGAPSYDESPGNASTLTSRAAPNNELDSLKVSHVKTPSIAPDTATSVSVFHPDIHGPAVYDSSPAPGYMFQSCNSTGGPPIVSDITTSNEPRTPAQSMLFTESLSCAADWCSGSILVSLTKAYESSMKPPGASVSQSSQPSQPISSLNEYLSQFEDFTEDNESDDDDESDDASDEALNDAGAGPPEPATIELPHDAVYACPEEEDMVSLSNEVYEGTPRYTMDATDVIDIIDEPESPRPDDMANVAPLQHEFKPGVRLKFGGSVSKAIFKMFQRIKQIENIDPVIADVLQWRLVLAKEADKTYKDHVDNSPARISTRLRNTYDKTRAETKVQIKGLHITTGEFVDCLKPRGEVCQNMMSLCCKAIMLDWESKSKIILDQQTMSELLKDCRKCNHGRIAGRLKKLALEEIDQIFLPVLNTKHWFLAVVNISQKLVQFFDSILVVAEGQHPYKDLWTNLCANLRHAYCLARAKTVDFDHFETQYPPSRKQKNTHDCGFHVIQELECHGTEDLVDYSKKRTMRPYRHYLCHCLIYHRFNDLNPLRPELRQQAE